ncbi:hypothetical protein AGMMS49545_01100 [Betaproteobacteria bacterium]|nr:hypothetical protein AGMMS49545_01100 [Betaproteobacteria bacterium]GHU48228.1 hypothetical protein AGMMS50289_24560 [Betaproteobacteria bacterium]
MAHALRTLARCGLPVSILLAALLLLIITTPPAAAAPANAPTKPVAGEAAGDQKPARSKTQGDVYLKQVGLDEAAQLISQIGGASIVVTSSVANKVVSLYLRDVTVEGMVKNLSRAAGVWYRFDAQTNAYLLMSAQEYREDIAITRDDMTRTFVLRHHNVVSIANAIRALLGGRVTLVEPVEEMAPLSMGGTTRTQGGGSGARNGGGANAGGGGGNSGGQGFASEGAVTRSMGGSTPGANTLIDPRKALERVSQNALEASLNADSSTAESFGASALTTAASHQGPPINVTYNKLHNLLMVRSGDELALQDIENLIREMDRPPRQVLLEMKIVEVELGKDFRSVFDIGVGSDKTANGPLGLGFNGTSPQTGSPPFPKRATLFGNFAEEDNPTMVWQMVSDKLRVRLQLLEEDNRVNVLATPMVVAANNQPARLFIGDEQILVTGASADSTIGTTGATNTTITVETEQRNVGQTLIILPRINADRSVTLTIDQDNSRVNPGATALPLALPDGTIYRFPIDTVNTANLQVTAHAQDGLTVAVGGMISQKISHLEQKVPVLGDLPLLGVLFKKVVQENSRSQIVLLITPWVLETAEESDALARAKEKEAQELGAAKRAHSTIFDAAPATDGGSPLLDLLNPARSQP